MTADDVSMQTDRAQPARKRSRLVQLAPDSEAAETRPKLSAARGILIGAGVCAVFWGAVAAVVVAAQS